MRALGTRDAPSEAGYNAKISLKEKGRVMKKFSQS